MTNDVVEVLDEKTSRKIRAERKSKREDCKILTPRWVFTDKRDGLRAKENNLGIKPSARLVVPGFKDVCPSACERMHLLPPAGPAHCVHLHSLSL